MPYTLFFPLLDSLTHLDGFYPKSKQAYDALLDITRTRQDRG